MPSLRDQELAGAILQALRLRGRLHLVDRVEVQVEDAVALLLGVVCSATERREAAEAARSVPGVTGVINRLTVSIDGERPDREIQAAVERAIAGRPELVGNVGCQVEDGVVRLIGHMQHQSQETLAISVAGSIRGVEAVISELTISELAPGLEQPPLDEATLAGRVADALTTAGISIGEGGPEVTAGVVTLSGKIRSWKERQRAGRVIAEVDGVRAVRNRLVLRKDIASSDADEALAARVVEALRLDGRVSPSAVLVEATGDTVLLSGTVNSPADQEAAEEVARRVPGVRHVVNDLQIGGWLSGERFVGQPPEEFLT